MQHTWRGAISDVRMYERVLSVPEVTELQGVTPGDDNARRARRMKTATGVAPRKLVESSWTMHEMTLDNAAENIKLDGFTEIIWTLSGAAPPCNGDFMWGMQAFENGGANAPQLHVTYMPSEAVTIDGKVKANALCIGDDCVTGWNAPTVQDLQAQIRGRLGATRENPAASCYSIFEAYPESSNGKYWLRPTSATYQAYCLMQNVCGNGKAGACAIQYAADSHPDI